MTKKNASVKVAVLKAKLSAYLRRAQRGERVVVMDRDTAIAELGPLSSQSESNFDALVASGQLQLATQSPKNPFAGTKLRVDVGSLLDEVRGDR